MRIYPILCVEHYPHLSAGKVKGRIKLEAYPGQDPIENAREMLSAAAKKADAEGFPIDFHS